MAMDKTDLGPIFWIRRIRLYVDLDLGLNKICAQIRGSKRSVFIFKNSITCKIMLNIVLCLPVYLIRMILM